MSYPLSNTDYAHNSHFEGYIELKLERKKGLLIRNAWPEWDWELQVWIIEDKILSNKKLHSCGLWFIILLCQDDRFVDMHMIRRLKCNVKFRTLYVGTITFERFRIFQFCFHYSIEWTKCKVGIENWQNRLTVCSLKSLITVISIGPVYFLCYAKQYCTWSLL